MKIKSIFFILVLLVVSSIYANNVSNLKGELSVDSGALNYSVPLSLPVGTAGVQPKISLNYNSNGSNGYFGVGWNLTGLSAIARCGSNLAVDGKKQGIKYDNSDNICMDGQRLVLKSGNKWGSNSEYRTQIESYSKIIYNGDDFKVWTKAGDIKEYSLINRNWFLRKVSDRFGNSINYNYFSNATEVYLQDITYADNTVQLNYEDKLDTFNGYSGGKNIQMTKRVKSIDIKSENTTLRTYELEYAQQSSPADKSVLTSLTECSAGVCLEPVVIEYTPKSNIKINNFQNWGSATHVDQYRVSWADGSAFLDVNGDGLPDRVHHYNYAKKQYGYWVQINNGEGKGFSEFQNWGQNATNSNQYRITWPGGYSGFVDVNGDGLPDRVHHYNYATKQYGYWVQINSGSGFGKFEYWGGATHKDQYRVSWPGGYSGFVDVNGDGLPDRVHHYNYATKQYGYWVQINSGSGFGKFEYWGGATHKDQYRVSWPGGYSGFVDVNGDGLPDRVHHHNYGTNQPGYWVQLNTGQGFGKFEYWGGATHKDQYRVSWNGASGFVDVNGDGLPDRVHHYNYSTKQYGYWVQINNGNGFNKLTSITDSFKNKTEISYKPLTDKSVYTKHTDGKYPNIDIQTPQQVVSSVTSTTSNEEEVTTNYKYEGLKVNTRGLGSLGFAKITTTNDLSNTKTVTSFNQNYPLIGITKNSMTYLDGELISQTNLDYIYPQENGIYQIQNTNQISKSYENGQLLKTATVTKSDFDNYGNSKVVTSKTVDETTGEEFIKTTHNTYTNDESNWILARLTKADVTSKAYGDTITKTSSFTYDNTTGILKTEMIEPDNSKWLKKSYAYDSHGNKIKEEVSGADVASRTTTTSYDGLGKFATKVTNALGHSESREYNADGQLLKLTSPNGLVTTWKYDTFGKKLQESRADGTSTNYSYEFDSSLPLSYYSITVDSDGASPVTTYFSKLNQKLRSEKIGFDGKIVISDTHYNKFGNVVKKSSPYFSDETPEYTYIEYDKYQRSIRTDTPAPNNQRAISTKSYNEYSMTEKNPKGQLKTTTKNVLGKIVKIVEEENAYQTYSYDALGNLLKTTDSQGNEIVLEYDIFGNKTYQNDPDMGEWHYSYNSLGQLLSQTDAKGQATTIKYDILGRKISENINGEVSTWIYDTTKVGQLHSESKPNFKRTYSYDSLLRLASTTTTADSRTFTKSFSYDEYSRLDTKTLPNNFKVKNVYNQYGYLEAIKSPKKQIADFDEAHFLNLIDQTLASALDYYEQSLSYKDKAHVLREKIAYYKTVANENRDYRARLLDIVAKLEVSAEQYEYYGQTYTRYASEYKTIADRYLTKSNSYSDSLTSEYYKEIADRYYSYSSQYASLTNQYLNKVYESSSFSANTAAYYLNIATQALNESMAAVQVAKQISQKSQEGFNSSIAYQEILDDSEYNYFYKVLEQDSYDRVNSYISGNGLITTKEYDASGVMNHITTGYNYDDGIRDLTFKYDNVLNVTSREDKKLNVSQTFGYDNLNRVISANTSTLDGSSNMSYSYDSIGNMTDKSDIGSYTYSQSNPHQVINAGERSFEYDLNGNMTNNNGTLIEYTAFNKPSKLSTPSDIINFTYDTNKNRYKKKTSKYTSYYLDKSYEQTIHTNSTTEDKYFIYANGQVVSIYTNSNNSYTKYLHYDSLGSVDTITNNLGVVEQRMAYKPFGEKLNLDKDGKTTIEAPYTNRGYTGHEHIEESKLIHMNARLYDPTIARFMSADSIIPDMYDTQAFNRYSYVKNNPLKYTDPSGHSWKRFTKWIKNNWRTIVTVIVAVVVSVFTFGAGMALVGALGVTNAVVGAAIVGATMGAAGGFAAGVVGTRLNGGSWRDALNNGLRGAATGAIMGGISGGFTGAIGEYASSVETLRAFKVAAQGLGGGVSSEIMGGEFKDGFKVAFMTAAASYLYSSVSSKYNTTSDGDVHPRQSGRSDVGKILKKDYWDDPSHFDKLGNKIIPLSSDQSDFMKWIGKNIYYGDSFAEFHDGLHDLCCVPGDQVSLIATMIPSYALTLTAAFSPYTNTYLMEKNIRKGNN